MPAEETIRESPPDARRDLLEQCDTDELADMLSGTLPFEVRSNPDSYAIWIPLETARDYLAEELEGDST